MCQGVCGSSNGSISVQVCVCEHTMCHLPRHSVSDNVNSSVYTQLCVEVSTYIISVSIKLGTPFQGTEDILRTGIGGRGGLEW